MARVLIVDDEESVRRLLVRLLERTGHTTWAAGNSQEALELIRMHDPDVVFSDVHLNNESGLAFADRIRRDMPVLPVVLISGDDGVPPAATLKPGVIRYVLKPINFAEVAQAIEDAVAWRTAAIAARSAHNSRLLPGGGE